MNLRHPRLKNQTDKLSFNEKNISKKLFFQFLSKFASYLCSTKRKQLFNYSHLKPNYYEEVSFGSSSHVRNEHDGNGRQ